MVKLNESDAAFGFDAPVDHVPPVESQSVEVAPAVATAPTEPAPLVETAVPEETGNRWVRIGRDVLSAEGIAAQAGSIVWEVLTSVSRRVPRFYREP